LFPSDLPPAEKHPLLNPPPPLNLLPLQRRGRIIGGGPKKGRIQEGEEIKRI